MFKIMLTIAMISSSVFAGNYIDEHVTKLNWNGIEVVWLEDNKLPTYDISIYFSEGALGETKNLAGVGELMFQQLTSGTTRFTQEQIIESLEFYGASYGSHLTHEYATFDVSGLMKDYSPTMKMVCHLFSSATFPNKELKKMKTRIVSSLESIVTKHGPLASHIFRYESLKGTGYETPVAGSIKTIKKISSKDLKKNLNKYNNHVSKRIYIKGPKEILGLKNIILNDCGWNKVESQRKVKVVSKAPSNKSIIFVPVPNANQAQVRIGRVIKTGEINFEKSELKTFAAKFMGGGFTSQLIQGHRVKKGLTYSAGAYTSEQRMYGRSGISTFTKNETIVDLIKTTQAIIKESSSGISEDQFLMAQKSIKGNYLLDLESTSEFLKMLMFFDHVGRDYKEIYDFSKRIDTISGKKLASMVNEIFDWEKQVILILGDKSVAKKLKEAGFKVKSVNYKNYL